MADETLMTADPSQAEAASTEAVAQDAAAQDQGQETAAEATTADAAGDGATEEQVQGEEDKDKPQGAPEAYEDFTFADGVEIDAEALGEFKDIAKELNLPQAEAQKVADLGAKMAQKWAESAVERHTATVAEWRSEAETDKEIGGDKLPETLAAAKRALDTFGTPEFRQLLDQTGLGSHREVLRFASNAGKTISEDTFVGADAQSAPANKAKALYSNSNMN